MVFDCTDCVLVAGTGPFVNSALLHRQYLFDHFGQLSGEGRSTKKATHFLSYQCLYSFSSLTLSLWNTLIHTSDIHRRIFKKHKFSSVRLLSCVRLFVTPWIIAHQASLSITNSRSLLKLMSIELVMPSSHLTLCRPLLLLASIFPSTRVFSNEPALHIRLPRYWSFSFIISPSNEHPGLIYFRMDWLDLLAVQGALKSLLQHHSSKASILRRSAFFTEEA